MSEAKIKVARVFPLWSDFQPIEKIYGYGGDVEGFSIDGGNTLLDNFDIGLDEAMMDRFGKMMDIAQKYGIKLIPSILTGWMSGRLFAPPAIADLNLIFNNQAINSKKSAKLCFADFFYYKSVIAPIKIGMLVLLSTII